MEHQGVERAQQFGGARATPGGDWTMPSSRLKKRQVSSDRRSRAAAALSSSERVEARDAATRGLDRGSGRRGSCSVAPGWMITSFGDQAAAADQGEAGGELLLLQAAGFTAEAAQGDAQQAGGEFDAFGIAADPEQLLGDAAGHFERRRMPVLRRARSFSRPCWS